MATKAKLMQNLGIIYQSHETLWNNYFYSGGAELGRKNLRTPNAIMAANPIPAIIPLSAQTFRR